MKSLIKPAIFTLALLAGHLSVTAAGSPVEKGEPSPLNELSNRNWFPNKMDLNSFFQNGAFKVYDLEGNLLMSSDMKHENSSENIHWIFTSDYLTEFAGTRIYIQKK
jgi:hypothetical protein